VYEERQPTARCPPAVGQSRQTGDGADEIMLAIIVAKHTGALPGRSNR
jgi:hypothetical protein